MVAVKGLSTYKIRVLGEREARKSGGLRSFKMYTDDDDSRTHGRDHVAADTMRESILLKAETTSHSLANCQKEALNKLDKIHGKHVESGRKALADISNSRGTFQKNKTVDGSRPGKGKERMTYSQRASVASGKDLKVFNGKSKARLQGQETVDDVTRESSMNYLPSQRKSLPVPKPADSVDRSDIKKGSLENKVKNKEKHGFSVKPKVGTRVVPQVSSARDYCPPQRKSYPVLKHANKVDKSDIKKGNLEIKVNKEKLGFSAKHKVGTTVVSQLSNGRDYRRRNRVSEGSIKVGSNGQSSGDAQRLSRISVKPKPTVKTAVGITRAQRVSSTSVFIKSTSATSVLFKKEEATSRFKSISHEQLAQDVNLDASTSNVIAKGKSRRQKSDTSLLMSRVSDGSMKVGSKGQASGDAQRLSRISLKPKPIVKTAAGIPIAERVKRSTSVFTKSTSATSVLFKKEETTSRSESISHEKLAQDVNLDASTSNVTAKGKSRRRKSYTSLLMERTKLLKNQGNVTKEETLPNIYDDCNQLEVAEYVDEIYQHYWVTEAHNQSLNNYMEIQTDITPQMRGILINWLIEVHLKFDLMQETLYLMVTLLDYYLSAVTIKKAEMQLIGLTSLLLASKYEDFWHPKVMELIGISAEVYTREQMLEMETTILKKLNFRLNLPTPYVFMLRFLRAAQGGKKFENLAFFLIELCLVEYDALHFKPSLLCASAIYVARCTLHLAPQWTPLLCKHSHYEEYQIRDCAEMILRFHQAARRSQLKVTYDKYMGADNSKVATIKPLDRLPPPCLFHSNI